jgi:predicted MFS family arabinose efflux permease
VASPKSQALVAARVVEGGWGATMSPQVLSIIQIQFARSARASTLSLYVTVLALGTVFGQPAGGVLVGADLWG